MTTFNTSLEIPATPEQVFAAIRHPERLARWWGPAGFTNSRTSNGYRMKSGVIRPRLARSHALGFPGNESPLIAGLGPASARGHRGACEVWIQEG